MWLRSFPCQQALFSSGTSVLRQSDEPSVIYIAFHLQPLAAGKLIHGAFDAPLWPTRFAVVMTAEQAAGFELRQTSDVITALRR